MAGIEKGLREHCSISIMPVRIFFAEFLGTMILISFGCGSVAQAVLSDSAAGSPTTWYIAWGLGVTFGVYVSGGVSGGHINPAITLAMCILGRTKWSLLPVYTTAQYLGAFVGAALVYGMYIDAFNHVDPDRTLDTAGIFATYPQEFLTIGNALLDQIYATSLLALLVLAVTDERNIGASKGLIPISVGLIVIAIGMTFGYNCGYAINPARDLSPRLFTLVAGWPDAVFEINNTNYFWIPVVGPHIGAIVGALLYLCLVGAHIPEADDKIRLSDNSRYMRQTELPPDLRIAPRTFAELPPDHRIAPRTFAELPPDHRIAPRTFAESPPDHRIAPNGYPRVPESRDYPTTDSRRPTQHQPRPSYHNPAYDSEADRLGLPGRDSGGSDRPTLYRGTQATDDRPNPVRDSIYFGGDGYL